jgi:WD40 repeat protein
MNLDTLKDQLVNEWKHELRTPQVDQQELEIIMAEMQASMKNLNNEMKRYKNELLGGKDVLFEKSSHDENIFGSLVKQRSDLMISKNFGNLVNIFKGPTNTITCMIHVPNTRILATTSFDKKIELWNFKTSSSLGVLHEHTEPVIAALIHPDYSLLIRFVFNFK